MLLLEPGNSRRQCGRSGATVVEFAVIAPVVFLFLIGFAILAMGVYRYQQVAYLAREGARYASTHGAQYRVDCGLPAGTQTIWTQAIRDEAVLPKISALDPEFLSVTASWSAGTNQANPGNSTGSYQSTIQNTVTVTVIYQWYPEAFQLGHFTLTSTATVPMCY